MKTVFSKLIALTMILTLVFSVTANADSKEAPAKKETNAALTVAESVKLIVDEMKLNIDHIRFIKQPQASDYFTKVPNDAAYADAFIIAHLNGLEVPKDIDPAAKVTKEQYLHFLTKALRTKGDFAMIEIFYMINDEAKVTPEYMNSLQTMLIAKVETLDKKGNIHPKASITQGGAMLRIVKVKKFMKEVGLSLDSRPDQQTQPEQPEQPVQSDEVTVTTAKVNDEVNKVTIAIQLPNPGYSFTIDRVEFAGDQAVVYYTKHLPEEGKMYAQVITEAKQVTFIDAKYKVSVKNSAEKRK